MPSGKNQIHLEYFYAFIFVVFQYEKCIRNISICCLCLLVHHHHCELKEKTIHFEKVFPLLQPQQQWQTKECECKEVGGLLFNNIKMIFDTKAKRITFQINITVYMKPISRKSELLVRVCVCASACTWISEFKLLSNVLHIINNNNNNHHHTIITTMCNLKIQYRTVISFDIMKSKVNIQANQYNNNNWLNFTMFASNFQLNTHAFIQNARNWNKFRKKQHI